MDIRDIRLYVDGRNVSHWDLSNHKTPDSASDDISGITATATNPHWLIDDHIQWIPIKQFITKGRIQTAFDPREETFYIADDSRILRWNATTGDSISYSVKGGARPMAYSNHLLYDTLTNSLINYNLSQLRASRFDFATGTWTNSNPSDVKEEPNFSNHAFAIRDSVAYAFGGYGFYKYRNNLFEINLRKGTVTERKLSPELPPLTSAAMGVIGDKLYIFGGNGNAAGRQELPTRHNYGLYEYDTKTWNGKLLWELDSVPKEFLPSQTMYYNSTDDKFYVASSAGGGTMIKLSRTQPSFSTVSQPIVSKMDYYDCVFDLFKSADGRNYYLLIDKRLDPDTHDYTIYSITYPFVDDLEILNDQGSETEEEGTNSAVRWIFIIAGIILLATICFLFALRRRRRRKNLLVSTSDSSVGEPINPATPYTTDKKKEDRERDVPVFDIDIASGRLPARFDRTRGAISLLGQFNVRSKNGEDITAKFTTRLKKLLIMLIIGNQNDKSGVKYQIIDEEIWPDKDEKSAQNNRNVYMRKLRLLLEEVGNIPIIFNKGFFTIDTANVTVDFNESMTRINKILSEGDNSPELLEETLELMLIGPLLPMTQWEWLDKHKGDYSDVALNLLHNLLDYYLEKDQSLAYRIAETISRHDLLSEEAMKVRCSILYRNKKVGLAQNIYNQFCKEYQRSLGEEYAVPFAQVCRN